MTKILSQKAQSSLNAHSGHVDPFVTLTNNTDSISAFYCNSVNIISLYISSHRYDNTDSLAFNSFSVKKEKTKQNKADNSWEVRFQSVCEKFKKRHFHSEFSVFVHWVPRVLSATRLLFWNSSEPGRSRLGYAQWVRSALNFSPWRKKMYFSAELEIGK